jgi:hypothetical protein
MAYDEELGERLRALLQNERGLSEKKIFGGLAFLINGNMAVSASSKGGLLLRVDPSETETLVAQPHAEPFEMRGRDMTGWLRIAPEGVRTDKELRRWAAIGTAYARSLPAK